MLFTAQILAIQAGTEYTTFSPLLLPVLTPRRPHLNGEAAGFFSFIRIFGQALGVAVSGVIFQNSLRQSLLRIPGFASLADMYSRDATAAITLIQAMEDGETKTRMINAFSEALSSIWLSLLAFSATGLLLSMTVKGYSMAQEHVTAQHLVQDKDGTAHEESGNRAEARTEKKA